MLAAVRFVPNCVLIAFNVFNWQAFGCVGLLGAIANTLAPNLVVHLSMPVIPLELVAQVLHHKRVCLQPCIVLGRVPINDQNLLALWCEGGRHYAHVVEARL